MEEEYRQGLNLVVEMLRSLEKLPDFRADTFTLQRIARLADSAKYPVSVEEPSTYEPPAVEETVPHEDLVGDPVQAQTAEPGAARPSFEELRTSVLACTKCPNLVTFRHSVVFGVGNPSAELMFVGEAPGADEDMRGEPFVGKAGELLTRIIETMGFTRNAVYIANVLKCRPDIPRGTSGNRPPTPEEMQTCLPYLRAQIEIIQPKVMVALGGVAMKGLFGTSEPMKSLRGRWH